MARYHLPRVLIAGCFAVALLSTSAYADDAQDSAPAVDTPQCVTYVDTEDRDNAEILGMKGVACFQDERYEWALTYYQRAYSMDPDPLLLGGIGRSLHELGLYEPALDYYRRYLDEDSTSSRATRIQDRVRQLETNLDDDSATISFEPSPSPSTAYVVLENGEWYELGDSPMEIDVATGDYQFVLSADDHRHRHVHYDIDEDTVIDEELTTFGLSERNRRRAALWTAGSSLVVGITGATLLTISSQERSAAQQLDDGDFDDLSDYDQRRRTHLDRARSTRLWGTAGTAVGITGMLFGSILYMTASSVSDIDDAPSEAQRWSPKPTVGVGQLGLQFHF